MRVDGDDEERRPILTVDVVTMTIVEDRLMVLLAKRKAQPFKGRDALIGGYVHVEEDADADATAARVLARKAGLTGMFLEQLRTFSGASRDPRGWSASVTYFALVPYSMLEGNVAAGMSLRPVEDPGQLPFDHGEIVAEALYRVRGKGAYSTLPARLLPLRFTLPELKRTYGVVMGETLDDSSFRRKMTDLDLIQKIEGAFDRSSSRPAQLYCLKPGVNVFERRI